MNISNNKIIYPDISYKIMGAAMKVHNRLGPGWDENTYHVALMHALKNNGLHAESKARGVLKNHNLKVNTFELDIIVENKIILELKHLISSFDPANYVQIINYLKYWQKDLGILINFGLDKLQYQRVPFFLHNTELAYSTSYKQFAYENNNCATKLKIVFSTILDQYGLGYSTNVYKKLFYSECNFRKIECEEPQINLTYKSISLGIKNIDAFLIDKEILVLITAMHEKTSAVHIARMLSYLRQKEMPFGIIANFSKNNLELRCITLQ